LGPGWPHLQNRVYHLTPWPPLLGAFFSPKLTHPDGVLPTAEPRPLPLHPHCSQSQRHPPSTPITLYMGFCRASASTIAENRTSFQQGPSKAQIHPDAKTPITNCSHNNQPQQQSVFPPITLYMGKWSSTAANPRQKFNTSDSTSARRQIASTD